jgi:hypothetical protein
MSIRKRLVAISNAVLCFVRSWWRPAICWSIPVVMHVSALVLIINGAILPVVRGTAFDWAGFAQVVASLALLVGAVQPMAYFRTKEKLAANADD